MNFTTLAKHETLNIINTNLVVAELEVDQN